MVRLLAILVIALIAYLFKTKGAKISLRMAPAPEKAEQEIRAAIRGSKWEPMSDLIVAQAKHETGNFTSSLYKENLNAFGMGRPLVRPTTDNRNSNKIVEGNTMASYNSVYDSAKDLLLWLEQWRNPPFPVTRSANTYARELRKRAYYTDTLANYQKALSRLA